MYATAPPLDYSALEKIREEELEEARAIQSAMVPTGSLRSGRVTITHQLRPVRDVGGDFLDYFTLSDRSIGLFLGDVSGKGLPAALYAALAVGTLRGIHKTGTCPADVLALVNRRLAGRAIPRRYSALQYAVFDPDPGRMRISSAGVQGPLHLSRNGCRQLSLPGIPPGMFLRAEYEMHAIQMDPGDSMIFFTDGITDARDFRLEEFGVERLSELCAGLYGEPPAELLRRIFNAVGKFALGQPQFDDMTAVVFHLAP
jgi:sigma-B regulation protein RsbU (phosphoserine phosphatase)